MPQAKKAKSVFTFSSFLNIFTLFNFITVFAPEIIQKQHMSVKSSCFLSNLLHFVPEFSRHKLLLREVRLFYMQLPVVDSSSI